MAPTSVRRNKQAALAALAGLGIVAAQQLGGSAFAAPRRPPQPSTVTDHIVAFPATAPVLGAVKPLPTDGGGVAGLGRAACAALLCAAAALRAQGNAPLRSGRRSALGRRGKGKFFAAELATPSPNRGADRAQVAQCVQPPPRMPMTTSHKLVEAPAVELPTYSPRVTFPTAFFLPSVAVRALPASINGVSAEANTAPMAGGRRCGLQNGARRIGGARRVQHRARTQRNSTNVHAAHRNVGARLAERPVYREAQLSSFDASRMRKNIQRGLQTYSRVRSELDRESVTLTLTKCSDMSTCVHEKAKTLSNI